MKVRFDATGDVIVITGGASGNRPRFGAWCCRCRCACACLRRRYRRDEGHGNERASYLDTAARCERSLGGIRPVRRDRKGVRQHRWFGLWCGDSTSDFGPRHGSGGMEPRAAHEPRWSCLVLPGGGTGDDVTAAGEHRRLQLRSRSSRMAWGLGLFGSQGSAHRLR